MVWEPGKYLKIFLIFMEGSRQDFVRRLIQAISVLFESVSSSIEVFRGASDLLGI